MGKSWKRFWDEIHTEEIERRLANPPKRELTWQERRERCLRRAGDGTDSDLTGESFREGFVEGLVNDDDWMVVHSYRYISDEEQEQRKFSEWATATPNYLFVNPDRKIDVRFVRRFYKKFFETERAGEWHGNNWRLAYLYRAGFDLFDILKPEAIHEIKRGRDLHGASDWRLTSEIGNLASSFYDFLKRYHLDVAEKANEISQGHLRKKFRQINDWIKRARKNPLNNVFPLTFHEWDHMPSTGVWELKPTEEIYFIQNIPFEKEFSAETEHVLKNVKKRFWYLASLSNRRVEAYCKEKGYEGYNGDY